MKKITIHRRNVSNSGSTKNYLGVQIDPKYAGQFLSQQKISINPLIKAGVGRSVKVLPSNKHSMSINEKSAYFMSNEVSYDGIYQRIFQINKKVAN